MSFVDDSLSLSTPESVVLDGANGVLAEPRQHFPHAPLFSVIAVVALVGAFLWLRPGARRLGLFAALLLAAVPGSVVVVALRADAPLRRDALAEQLDDTLDEVQAHAPWPGPPVAVVKEEDDVLFPLGRYALPARPSGVTPAVELELLGHRLDVTCRRGVPARHVVCGGAP